MKRVLALDPGVTTGVSACTLDPYSAKSEKWTRTQLRFDDSRNPEEEFFDSIANMQPTEVVYEAFDFRAAKNGTDLTPVRYIGIIRYFCQRAKIPYASIQPAQTKSFWDDKKLKLLGLWIPGKPHAMDATRIALTHLQRTDVPWFETKLNQLKELLDGSERTAI